MVHEVDTDPVAALYAKANKKNGELDSFDMSQCYFSLRIKLFSCFSLCGNMGCHPNYLALCDVAHLVTSLHCILSCGLSILHCIQTFK